MDYGGCLEAAPMKKAVKKLPQASAMDGPPPPSAATHDRRYRGLGGADGGCIISLVPHLERWNATKETAGQVEMTAVASSLWCRGVPRVEDHLAASAAD